MKMMIELFQISIPKSSKSFCENDAAIFDVDIFGSPFISNVSHVVELLLDIINGDDKFVFVDNFDECGVGARTPCGVIH
jgi:hypothetical protein